MERYEISGSPTPEEEAAILKALEQLLRSERDARTASAWKMAGRALATRNGLLDYRQHLPQGGWVMAKSLPWTGRPYNGRHGRGDAK